MSSSDRIHETQADPDSFHRTARLDEPDPRASTGRNRHPHATLEDSRTHASEAGRGVRRLGPYRRVRELARGGMGAVHEVIDERTGEHLALKTIRADLTDLEALDRFRREAQLTAQLQHPNIARLHHAQLDADPCYLVQDLLTGGTLEQRLKAGPLPPEEARQITLDLGAGLAHAHALGILHRDLSPRNVMFDAAGQPKLVDFGLARSLASWQRLTATGQLLGTPAYMAPEQALDAKSADARSDVYGLGGLLYAMLTGGAGLIPREAKTLPAAVEALQRWTPPPPRALNPQVPEDLDAICQRALAKDPLRRFSSVKAMLAALRGAPAPRDGSDASAALAAPAPPPSRRAALLLGLGGLGLALAVGLGFLLGRSDPAPDAPSDDAATATSLPTPGGTASPAGSVATPDAAPRWRLHAGQVLSFHLTRWLEVEQPPVLAALGLLLRLEVKELTPTSARLEGRIVRVRFWIDGPYSLRFDSNRPRVEADPRGEAQKALEAAVDQPFPVELDLRGDGAPRFRETQVLLQERVLKKAPKQASRYDRGWAIGLLVESLGRDALVRHFRGPRLEVQDGSPRSNHRERSRDGAREVERLERVQLYRIRAGDNLLGICKQRGSFVGWVAARNRIEAPSKIRVGDVLELPAREPRPDRVRVVALQGTGGRAPLVVARPWGVVLVQGRSGWAFAKLGEEGPWTRIQWGGGTAWVRTVETRDAPDAIPYAVTASALWARAEPREQRGNELGQLLNGQVYVAYPTRAQGVWFPLRFDERIAYSSRRYLQRAR